MSIEVLVVSGRTGCQPRAAIEASVAALDARFVGLMRSCRLIEWEARSIC